MTKEQIHAEISAKIEGQGSAIDAGSALPSILRGILDIAEAGANVQSDYTQDDSTKPDYIKNKPALKPVATSGSYDDLTDKPTIPASPGTESVSVVVRGCKYVSDSVNEDAPVAGGKVVAKVFNPATKETAVSEYPIPATGIVTLTVPHGCVYQVHSEVTGLSASFRLVFTSCQTSRIIALWNTSLGVYKYGYQFANDGEDHYRGFPFLATDGTLSTDDAASEWDLQEGESGEESGWAGIAVCTAASSFLVAPGSLALDDNENPKGIVWSKQAFCKGVPGLPNLYELYGDDWQDYAKADFDGGLNYSKILASFPTADAATFCAELAAIQSEYYKNYYLGSAGEMFALYENREAYAAIQEDYTDCPALGTLYYWSSSVSDRWRAVGVLFYDGHVYYDRMNYGSYSVLALSAFQFDY